MLQTYSFFFFFNDTATTEIYTLSLHDALPICETISGLQTAKLLFDERLVLQKAVEHNAGKADVHAALPDRKSTRLNSSHLVISYAVFCLKKKKKKIHDNSQMMNKYTHT